MFRLPVFREFVLAHYTYLGCRQEITVPAAGTTRAWRRFRWTIRWRICQYPVPGCGSRAVCWRQMTMTTHDGCGCAIIGKDTIRYVLLIPHIWVFVYTQLSALNSTALTVRGKGTPTSCGSYRCSSPKKNLVLLSRFGERRFEYVEWREFQIRMSLRIYKLEKEFKRRAVLGQPYFFSTCVESGGRKPCCGYLRVNLECDVVRR